MNVFHSPNRAALKAVNMQPLQTETVCGWTEFSSVHKDDFLFFFLLITTQLCWMIHLLSHHFKLNTLTHWAFQISCYKGSVFITISVHMILVSSVDRPALADNGRSGSVGCSWNLFFSFYLFILSIQYSCPWNSWASFPNPSLDFPPLPRTGVASFW